MFFADDGTTHDLGRVTYDKHREAAQRAARRQAKAEAGSAGVSRRAAVESLVGAPTLSPFDRFVAELRPPTSHELAVLSSVLRLPPTCFPPLDVSFWPDSPGDHGPAWAFPERDGAGVIIGYGVRFHRDPRRPDLHLKQARGHRGIYIPTTLTASLDGADVRRPILVPEGASDVAALVSVGVDTIGRSAARTGGDMIGEWLRCQSFAKDGCRASRPIVVIAENDLKPSGDWPGLTGARETARVIASIIARPVLVAFPPHGAKDARDAVLYYADRLRAGDMVSVDVGEIILDGVMELNEAYDAAGAITEPMVSGEPTGGDLLTSLDAHPQPMNGVAVDVITAVVAPPSRFGDSPCNRGPSLILHDPQTSQMGISRLSCKLSTCSTCLTFKRRRHQEQVQYHLSRHVGSVYRTYVAETVWTAVVQRRLRRLDANHFTITADDIVAAVSTEPVDERSTSLDPPIAAAYLCSRIGLLRFTGAESKAFNWSRTWRPLDRPRERRWTLVGKGNLDMRKTMVVLDDHERDWRMAQYASQGFPVTSLFFDAPDSAADTAKLVDDIMLGETLPDIDINQLFRGAA